MEMVNNYNNGGSQSQQPNVQPIVPVSNNSEVSQHSVGVQPLNCDRAMSVTSITDLQSYAAGTVVRFPDFAEGQPFVARVRRPSMLALAKQNKIPNSLLTTAGELFTGGGGSLDANNAQMLSDMYNVCHIICEACLLEPTLAEIESVGMELSDDQIMAIFNYTQTGIKALEPFREE